MKKKQLFLVALLLSAVGLSGCGDDDEWEEMAQNLDKEFEYFHKSGMIFCCSHGE